MSLTAERIKKNPHVYTVIHCQHDCRVWIVSLNSILIPFPKLFDEKGGGLGSKVKNRNNVISPNSLPLCRNPIIFRNRICEQAIVTNA